MQVTLNSTLDFLDEVIKNSSEVPGQVIDLGESWNDDIIQDTGQINERLAESGESAEQNIRQTEIGKLGSKVANYLSDPVRLVTSIVLVFAIFWGVTKWR